MLASFFSSATPTICYPEVKNALKAGSFDFSKFLAEITIERLLAIEKEGEDEGCSLLWLLALYSSEHPEYFLLTFEKFNKQIKLQDILVKPTSGPRKGMALLWLLVVSFSLGQKEPFLAAWQKFSEELKVEHLRAKPEDGCAKGASILWMIISACNIVSIDFFLLFWEKFHLDITLEDLRDAPEEGPGKKLKFLWYLAHFAFKGHPLLFQSVWDRFQNDLTAEDFRCMPLEDSDAGRTIIWVLAIAALRQQPRTFLAVWQKLKSHFCYQDLEQSILLQNQPISVFDIICRLPEGKQIILEILSQMSGYPSDRFMAKLQDISPELHRYTQDLLAKKKALNEAIVPLRRRILLKGTITELEFKNLFNLGEASQKAGYLNAFHDIFQLLKEHTTYARQANEAKLKIPSFSWHNHVPPSVFANMYYETAKALADFPEMRQLYLILSLSFAVQIIDEERNPLFHAICHSYISGENSYDPIRSSVSPLSCQFLSQQSDFAQVLALLSIIKNQYEFQRQPQPAKSDMDALATAMGTQLSFSQPPTQSLLPTTPSATSSAAAAAMSPTHSGFSSH